MTWFRKRTRWFWINLGCLFISIWAIPTIVGAIGEYYYGVFNPGTRKLDYVILKTDYTNYARSKILQVKSDADELDFVTLSAASGGSISDEAYNATTWNDVVDTGASKNAIRDEIESIRSTYLVVVDGNPGVTPRDVGDTFYTNDADGS